MILVRTLKPAAVSTLLTVCLVATGRANESEFALLGSFGFNWLAPESATCKRVDTNSIKQLASCKLSKSGAFGLALTHYVCRIDRNTEFLAFQSAAACEEALETMQANAP